MAFALWWLSFLKSPNCSDAAANATAVSAQFITINVAVLCVCVCVCAGGPSSLVLLQCVKIKCKDGLLESPRLVSMGPRY